MNKKSIWLITPLIIIILITPVILSSCKNNEGFSPVFLVDANGNYSGFNGVQEPITLEKAASMGYVAVDGQRIVENIKIWDNFLSTSSRGTNSSIRLVYFMSNKSVYLVDLFYNEGKYFIFDNTAEQQNTIGFNHLLKLEGSFGMPARETIAYILADDESIAFDDYMTAMFSSSTDVIQSVQPSRLIMFLLPED